MNRRSRPTLSLVALVAVVLLLSGLVGAFRPAQAAVLSPTITSVSPSQVYPGKQNQQLVLSGDFTSGNSTVTFTPATGITIVGSPATSEDLSQIRVTINVAADAPNTARDVTVQGGILNGSSTCAKCLTIGPDITAAAGQGGTLSNSANSGVIKVDGHAFKAGAAVKIERKGYGFGAAETSTINGTNVQVTPGTAQNGMVSSLTATVNTLHQPAGRWKVTVVNPDGNTASFGDGVTSGLEVAGGKPTLATISPAQINTNQELQFTVTGDNFARGLTATVSDGGVTQTQAAHITSKTQAEFTLRASSSPGSPGARTLVLRNADGQSSSNAGALWVNQAPQPAGTPTISSVSPAVLGLGADKVSVRVTGTNFGSTPTVSVSNPTGITITRTRDSSTQLTLTISVANNAATGARSLTITNPDNATVTQNNALTITSDFTVTHAVPNGRPQGYTGNFQVLGAGFSGSPSVTISGGGATAGSVTVDSPARLTVGVVVTANATPGARDITVTQGNVQKICTGCFIVGEQPTITTISPTSGNGGGQVDVTVNGTKFADNPSVSLEKAEQNPINMILVNRESTSKITGTFDLTNAAPGVWNLRVTNVDGGSVVKADAFTVAVGNPTVTSSNPDFVTQNDTTEVLRITGSQFAPGMTVTIPDPAGVTVKDTKRLSNTTADVTIATSDTARLGSRDIKVTNTDGKSGTCTACFVVTQGQQAKNFGPGVTAFENFTNGAFVAAGNLDAVPVNGTEFVVAVNAGGGPHVRPYRVNPTNGNVQELGPGWYAYPAGFTGGVHVAIGDVDGNAANGDEIITAAGPSGGPHVKVWRLNNDLSATEIGGFFAYVPQFTGGVWVASGDVDGDGKDEIITGPGPGGGPHVRVWKYANGNVTEFGGWFAYPAGFTGGVVVGAGNVVPEDSEAAPKAEVLSVPGSAGGPHLRITTGTGQLLRQFFAFDSEDANGYRITAGDFDFDTIDDIAVARGSNSEMLIAQVSDTGYVRIVDPNPTPFGNLPTGTNVAAGDVDGDGDADVIIVPDHNNAVTVRLLRATALT